MNDMNVCGNHEALVGYLYDECEPVERETIAAHVAVCMSCAGEVRSLRDTRAHLGAWTPPALPLGFQITRTEGEAGPVPLKPRFGVGGWRQPLPAWAQVAAAVLIFAAGMSVNTARSTREAPAPAVAQAPAPATTPVAETSRVDDMRVTRAEFARLEARLRSIENADVQLASRTGHVDQDELFTRISAIEDRLSEGERQNLGRFAMMARALEANRRDIDASREATLRVNQMESELQDHRQVLRSAIVPGGLAVRTALTNGGR
jgi:hypothetical protein